VLARSPLPTLLHGGPVRSSHGKLVFRALCTAAGSARPREGVAKAAHEAARGRLRPGVCRERDWSALTASIRVRDSETGLDSDSERDRPGGYARRQGSARPRHEKGSLSTSTRKEACVGISALDRVWLLLYTSRHPLILKSNCTDLCEVQDDRALQDSLICC
jgi:hypothetical protein